MAWKLVVVLACSHLRLPSRKHLLLLGTALECQATLCEEMRLWWKPEEVVAPC